MRLTRFQAFLRCVVCSVRIIDILTTALDIRATAGDKRLQVIAFNFKTLVQFFHVFSPLFSLRDNNQTKDIPLTWNIHILYCQ